MTAQKGNKVKVHYRGTLSDGEVFDESYNDVPLEFSIGSGAVIPGFENGIIGMAIGDKKNLFIPAKDAYGEWTEELIIEFSNENIPNDLQLEIGSVLQLQLSPEQVVNVEVIEIKSDSVVFDANHKLADQDLNFEVELLTIE